ncbi:Mss4-like protein [Aspergillus heterothallicus]
MNGRCLCEGVQFSIVGEPENVFLCYCTHCSKNAGAAGQICAKIKREDVKLERGDELLKTWVLRDTLSGSEKHKVFCSQCGCTLWTIPWKHGGHHLVVRTALLDDGAEFFAENKERIASEAVQSFKTMPGY